MFEFGDELMLNSYRIPWLIWIHLLSLLLLLILLYYFTLTPSRLSLHFSAAATATGSPSATTLSFLTSAATTTPHNSKIRENEINEITTRTNTSEVVQRAKKPDVRQRAEPSTVNEQNDMMFQQSHHPCNLFGLAKQAFLKCLGIDSIADRHHEKDD